MVPRLIPDTPLERSTANPRARGRSRNVPRTPRRPAVAATERINAHRLLGAAEPPDTDPYVRWCETRGWLSESFTGTRFGSNLARMKPNGAFRGHVFDRGEYLDMEIGDYVDHITVQATVDSSRCLLLHRD